MKRLDASATEVVTAAEVEYALEIDADRWRRIRAATCEVSSLAGHELDRHALRVFEATVKATTKPARLAHNRDLGGGTASAPRRAGGRSV